MQFSPEKDDVTLNITKVKYTMNFQIMPLIDQNKTQIASDTHRYKKMLRKYLSKGQIIHTNLYIRKCDM